MKTLNFIVFYQINEVPTSHIHLQFPINFCISVKIISLKKNCLKLPQSFACVAYCQHANDNTHDNRLITVPMCKNGRIPCVERWAGVFENFFIDEI